MLTPKEPEYAPFCDKLRFVLNEAKLMQKDVAEGTGLSKPTITYWIKGYNEPTLESMKKLMEFLHTKNISIEKMENLWQCSDVPVDKEWLKNLAQREVSHPETDCHIEEYEQSPLRNLSVDTSTNEEKKGELGNSSSIIIQTPETHQFQLFTRKGVLLILGALLLIGMSSTALVNFIPKDTNTLPSYISGHATFLIFYPLTTKPFGWDESTQKDGRSCLSQRDGYHISSGAEYDHQCLESSTVLSNFVLQVQMHINGNTQDGQGGGIVFRHTEAGTDLITLYSDGTYQMHKSNNKKSSSLNGISYFIPNVSPTKDNSYLLAIAVNGSSIIFYINKQKIATATDNTYKNGWIGLKVDGEGRTSNTVVFTNLTIWTLPNSSDTQ